MKRTGQALPYQYAALQGGYWIDYLIVASFGVAVLKFRGFEPGEISWITSIGAVLTIVLQLTVMLIGLDVLTPGLTGFKQKRPGIASLVMLSCVFSLIDGVRYHAVYTIENREGENEPIERLFYFDETKPFPQLEKGETVRIIYHDREIGLIEKAA